VIAPAEQKEILQRVRQLATARVSAARKVAKSEWTPRMANEKIKAVEAELIEYLGRPGQPHIQTPSATEWQAAYMQACQKNAQLTEQLRTRK
jgi:glutaminase